MRFGLLGPVTVTRGGAALAESVVWNERALSALRASDGRPHAVGTALLNVRVEYQQLGRHAEAFDRFDDGHQPHRPR